MTLLDYLEGLDEQSSSSASEASLHEFEECPLCGAVILEGEDCPLCEEEERKATPKKPLGLVKRDPKRDKKTRRRNNGKY